MNIENILETNNDGVRLLQAGCYRDAICVFRNAMRQIRDLSQFCINRSRDELQFPLIVDTQFIPHSIPKTNYIYQNALVAKLDGKESQCEKRSLTSHQDQDEVMYHPAELVVYNLSIANHLAISSGQVKSKKAYHRAQALYEKALKALQIRQISEGGSAIKKYPLRDIICLGILNNIGVLNYEYNCYGHAKACFDALRGLINNSNLSVLGEAAHRGMLVNAWLLDQPETARAA